MTLNKKTIKSVCSHMSQSRPRWGAGSLASECPQKKKSNSSLCSLRQSPAKSQPRKGRNYSKWIETQLDVRPLKKKGWTPV